MAKEQEEQGKRDELRYLEALVESYPEPMSHTELAARVGVTKPAITRAKDKLMPMVDLRQLAYDKFVLKSDSEGFGKVAEAYFRSGRIAKFLTSKFVVLMIRQYKLHDEIAKFSPNYAAIFDKHETEFMVEILIRNLSVLRDISFVADKRRDRPDRLLMQLTNVEDFEQVIPNLDLAIKDEASLRRILILRDKWFAFVFTELGNQVKSLEILNKMTRDERRTYEEVYVRTIDFYLRKIFVALSMKIAKIAERKVEFNPEYHEISRFYSLPRRIETKQIA